MIRKYAHESDVALRARRPRARCYAVTETTPMDKADELFITSIKIGRVPSSATDSELLVTGIAAGLPIGEPSGADTFNRYRYQAKMTLIFWLGTLTDDGPLTVYAEHIEDILLEYSDRLVFIQVKTRAATAGNWTADSMCSEGGGIDSLARAYAVAHDRPCTFELHIEGPISSSYGTSEFVKYCANASPALRTKVRSILTDVLDQSVSDEHVDDFLSRLRIHSRLPGQHDIDNKCIRILGELAPTLSVPEVSRLFGDLLQIVERAQEATYGALGSGVGFLEARLAYLLTDEPSPEQVIACKRLSRHELVARVPLPSPATALLLIERSLSDKPATILEEKLIASGASDQVIRSARNLRAMSDLRRIELLSGPISRDDQLDDVCSRVLIHAESRAQLCKTNGESTDDLFAYLTLEHSIEDSDQAALFNRDRLALVGLLCCLSDECRFRWRA